MNYGFGWNALLVSATLLWWHLGAIPAASRQTDTTTVRYVDVEFDSLTYRVVDGREVSDALNPRLREGDTFVSAERMTDEGRGQLLFYRNVRIINESDTLTAERVLYDRNTKIGRAVGSVRLGDGEVVVTAPEGDYDTREKRADFRAGVTLVDSASVLTSLGGSYWTDDKRAEFAGDVRLRGDSLDVAADSLTYLREARSSIARGRVVIRRVIDDGLSWIFGDRARNEEDAGLSMVHGNVFLLSTRIDSAGASPDTLMLSAGRLRSVRTDSLERFTAVDSVRLWRQEFAAVADSIDFRRLAAVDSTGRPTRSRLLGHPVSWFRSTQVQGDTLDVVGRGESMDTLRVTSNAFVARLDTTTGRIRQLKGSRLLGLFRSDSLRSVQVSGRAEALHWMDTDEGGEGGALRVSADRIEFRLEGDEITDLRVYDGVDGVWYPADLIDESLDLEGLDWAPARRPDPAVFRRRFRAVACRLEVEACPAEMSDLSRNP